MDNKFTIRGNIIVMSFLHSLFVDEFSMLNILLSAPTGDRSNTIPVHNYAHIHPILSDFILVSVALQPWLLAITFQKLFFGSVYCNNFMYLLIYSGKIELCLLLLATLDYVAICYFSCTSLKFQKCWIDSLHIPNHWISHLLFFLHFS